MCLEDECVEWSQVCDGRIDCRNSLDELRCREYNWPFTLYAHKFPIRQIFAFQLRDVAGKGNWITAQDRFHRFTTQATTLITSDASGGYTGNKTN